MCARVARIERLQVSRNSTTLSISIEEAAFGKAVGVIAGAVCAEGWDGQIAFGDGGTGHVKVVVAGASATGAPPSDAPRVTRRDLGRDGSHKGGDGGSDGSEGA